MNKTARLFLIIGYIEIFFCVAYPIYISLTQNLELGALVIWFIFFVLFLYYAFLCGWVNRIGNKAEERVGLLIFLNILPILLLFVLFLLG